MDNFDKEIKMRLQKDELISKKAEDIFENFFKEENFMEENKEGFVNTPNPSNKPNKTIKWRKALPIAACLVVALGCGNIYASTQGYGNVFFLVKYLVTGDKSVIKGKDAILSDRDITISYETIKLTENIRMQIRNFQVKDNEAKLILAVNEENLEKDTKVVPLRYKVYNSSNELLCDKRSAKAYNQYLSEYTEELILNNYNQEDNILLLEVYKSNDERLAKITIDLNTREITIDGEEEALQKVSEIELKKYLGFISEFEQTNKNNNDGKIHFAEAVITNIKDGKGYTTNNGYAYEVSDVNGILESLGYEKVSNTFKKGELFQRRTINGTDYFDVLSPTGGFEPNTVIEISDISYCAGLYTAEFSYAFIKSDDSFNTDYSNVDKKVATIYFKVNEDDKYSKFKVVKYVEVVDNGFDSNNQESITLSQAEAEKVLKEKFELLEKLYFSPYGYFKMDSEYVEQGCRILNFEEAVNTNFTKNMAKTIKEYLPMGVHIYNGQYYAADYGGYLSYSGLSGFENIVITSDTITANVVTKQIDPNDKALPNKKNQIKIVKSGNKWLIDSFDVAKVFYDEIDDTNDSAENTSTKSELVGSWKPVFAKRDGQDVSLREVYGSSITDDTIGELKFTKDGKYTEFVGIYSSELEDELQGDYFDTDSAITLYANSGKKKILVYENIDGVRYIEEEKVDGNTITFVYFQKVEDTNETVKECFQKYLNLVGAREGSPSSVLMELKLINEESTIEAKKSGFLKTNVKYSKFKETMLNYITEKCYEKEFAESYIEEDGYVCYFNGGATGMTYEVSSITKDREETYTAKVIWSQEETRKNLTCEFGIETNNGKCVIDYCYYH